MRILYVFPHPDDESFGPALAIAAQRRAGHSVHLLTLTRGGATKQRHRLGLSIDEMGEVRYREMLAVREVLQLESMQVLDYPDGELAGLDPRTLEREVETALRALEPEVVVTYAVRGVSGFPDHLVAHAIVKSAWCDARESLRALRRLAFFTIAPGQETGAPFPLFPSREEDIDCIQKVSDEDREIAARALDCYETYRPMIEQANPLAHFPDGVPFEFFGETHKPPLRELTALVP